MKKINSILLLLFVAFFSSNLFGQANVNPTIAVLPANSGIVAVGGVLDLQITVGATGSGTVAVAKLRPVITVPAEVTFLANASQTGLPVGWTILSNSGSQLRVCNTTDPIVGNTSRTIILKVRGVTTTVTPQTFSGQMNFGNGTTCAAGTAPGNNNTADDFATSTITVQAVVPLSILDFSGASINCEPTLKWTTSSETNTNRFEVEKSATGNDNWKAIATVTASGNSSTNKSYSYVDKDITGAEENLFYRLKMIDTDGRFSYSRIVHVLSTCKSAKMLVYPNPAENGRLNVSLAGTTGNVQATLIAVTGEVILTNKLINGINYLNISNVADGMYILNVKDANGFDKNTKVIVKH
jgi:hypothetical protein